MSEMIQRRQMEVGGEVEILQKHNYYLKEGANQWTHNVPL